MRILRALLIDARPAFIVDCCDISEEQESLVVLICMFVDALLSEVFENDLLAAKLVSMIRGAVSSSSKTVLLNEIVAAVHAFPVHEMWGH